MAKVKLRKIATGLCGVAGEHFVAGELSLQGYLATLTQRNAKSIDILVSNANATKSAAIQVKTHRGSGRGWILTDKAEKLSAPRLFYVFVNLGTSRGVPEYFVVPSQDVAKYVKTSHRKWRNTPGRLGQTHKDTTIRKFVIQGDEYKNDWAALGLD